MLSHGMVHKAHNKPYVVTCDVRGIENSNHFKCANMLHCPVLRGAPSPLPPHSLSGVCCPAATHMNLLHRVAFQDMEPQKAALYRNRVFMDVNC